MVSLTQAVDPLYDPFILDDWALHPLTPGESRHFLEILDDRYQAHTTAIANQVPIDDRPIDHWHEWFPDATVADAVLDRIIHQANRIAIQD